jgi:chromosome segregation protein
MGENSYKNMRASGMDDVIFSGTASRPSRNMAEVTIVLDNTSRTAPVPFNDQETIEIARRIEREAGSAFRINGRDVRARDVQLLFADASTGARSPALVRQGQIGELINAKPQARRRILEEAAGITGLHARRHEAELKLRAAEANLQRIEDVVGQLESQLAGLKRQVRQATRYKNISAEIRRLEAARLYREWAEARTAAGREQAQLDAITRVLAQHTLDVSEATRKQQEASGALPRLREVATAQAAALQRLILARQSLDEEELRTKARQAETEAHLAESQRDLAREQERLGEAAQILAGLAQEQAMLLAGRENERELIAEAEQATRVAAEGLAHTQELAETLNVRLSTLLARRDALDQTISDQRGRLWKFEHDIADILERREILLARAEAEGLAQALGEAVETAEVAARQAEIDVAKAEAEAAEADRHEELSRQTFEEARRQSERLETEIATLVAFLQIEEGSSWPPLMDAMTVEPGFEKALGAALGDELAVPTEEAAPVHWRSLPPLDQVAALPAGAQPLSDFITAPRGLDRRLRHIGVVEAALGQALQSELKPGQRLVSRDGHLWRWDGFTIAADVPTAPAKRLAERNRLQSLQTEAPERRTLSEAARLEYAALQKAAALAHNRERTQREAWRSAVAALDAARRSAQQQEREGAARLQQIGTLEEAHRRLCEGANEIRAQVAESETALKKLPVVEDVQAELQGQRELVVRHQARHNEARARHESLEREARRCSDRLQAIGAEHRQWSERSRRTDTQITELSTRVEAARVILAELSQVPEQIEAKRTKLLTLRSQAEAAQRQASDALAAGEQRLQQADGALKTAGERLSATREEHARSGARVEAAGTRLEEKERRITEQFGCTPPEVARQAGFEEGKLPDQESIEHKLGQLRDERERLGGVNLLAEDEAKTVQQQLDALKAERDDLVQAVAKLRSGIHSLNREGRQRLVESFASVNRNFGALFTTLFSGGRAELQLIESDDPLEAGLEIMAHPPGKKPQVLSLLSGGEQALTALALIFAVFLTNPSPICVLDEVDAPLDDHNVERFCNLLDAMLERTDTRFLIITHHALTMARMHRLFGVTMMERGVSQLVSVDLKAAEGLREAS